MGFAAGKRRQNSAPDRPTRPLQSEISHRSTSVAIIRRMAYSLAKPVCGKQNVNNGDADKNPYRLGAGKWSGEDKLDFLLRTLKRIG